MSKMRKLLYDPATGIHRAKGWEIALYALNNSSTNLYTMAFMYVSYFLIGIVGTSVALASILATALRVWDGVTDPFIGFIVDKTDGKFGKNRPFIVLGQIIMLASTALIFMVCPKLNEIIHGEDENSLYLREELKELPLYAVRGIYSVQQEALDQLIEMLNQKQC